MALIHGSGWIQASMWSFEFRRFPNAASPRLHNYDLPASGQPLPVGTRSLRCPAEVHYSPTQISQYLTHPSCKLIAIMKTVPFIVGKANHSDIQDLSDDVLVLVLSLLHGQDIARCTRVRKLILAQANYHRSLGLSLLCRAYPFQSLSAVQDRAHAERHGRRGFQHPSCL